MEFELGKSYDRLRIGEKASFTKTISETDVYLFAGISGENWCPRERRWLFRRPEGTISLENRRNLKPKQRRRKKWLLPT
jgi:hypothetical protein